MSALSLELPPELIERVAERAAELVAERQAGGEDRWLRGAAEIALYVGCSRSRVYQLATTTPARIPVERDGASLIARAAELDAWIRSGGDRCPASRTREASRDRR